MRIRGYEGLYCWMQWREALAASQPATGSNIVQQPPPMTDTSEQSDASSALLHLQRAGGVPVWRPPPSGELRNIATHALNQLMETMPLQNADQLTFLKVRSTINARTISMLVHRRRSI